MAEEQRKQNNPLWGAESIPEKADVTDSDAKSSGCSTTSMSNTRLTEEISIDMHKIEWVEVVPPGWEDLVNDVPSL
ncbi:Uu.00g002760.m01.CDS01 [Anthostomella pinea]|uniref:Uu.00g002760.m01.CDS01 n=1 Tax=Anthostomella pinea TaxID=933095 RepID=A0AAI8VKL3_9PEZI|nr:Uu.00g002760.m01.CDS01 [Anthostomella pinea]